MTVNLETPVRLSLPSMDVITQPDIRQAVTAAIELLVNLRRATDISGMAENGAGIPADIGTEELAELLVTRARADERRAASNNALNAAYLGEGHFAEWQASVEQEYGQRVRELRKLAPKLLAVLDELDLWAGMRAILSRGLERPVLTWRPGPEGFQVGVAEQALRQLLDATAEPS